MVVGGEKIRPFVVRHSELVFEPNGYIIISFKFTVMLLLHKTELSFFLAMGLVLPSLAQTQKEIDQTIQRMYQTLSFTDGTWENAEQLLEVFLPEGKLISNAEQSPQVWTPEQYIQTSRANLSKRHIRSVEEKELHSKTDLFGKIAQRFSTYQVRFNIDGKEVIRKGINAIQLIWKDGKWMIVSIIWDRESDTLKIPVQYNRE
ncbi:hypothetical protein [Ohtaekwangia sp.]|uniref:hypothetical protein n=1 Tax=Ohtaekwangia sp. TaxID=2066019 RepID=UPI002FDD9B07